MEVSAELMEDIKRGLESVDFGKVTISVDSNSLTADVSVEKRTRHKIEKRRESFMEGIERK